MIIMIVMLGIRPEDVLNNLFLKELQYNYLFCISANLLKKSFPGIGPGHLAEAPIDLANNISRRLDRLYYLAFGLTVSIREIVYWRTYVRKFTQKNWSQCYCVQTALNTRPALTIRRQLCVCFGSKVSC